MPSKKEIPSTKKPTLGISACLLGEEVRFDGGHKHDRWISGTLSEFFDLVAVCPEVAIGLGTCLLYTSPSPRDGLLSPMPSSA